MAILTGTGILDGTGILTGRGILFQSGILVPPSFSPLDLSPALWLDASDASTLYDSTVGGSLVAPDGTIARWEDKSGNGRHATQSTGVSQPLRKVAIQNGKDVVRFDGANDYIASLASPIPMAESTIFIVMRQISDRDFGGLFSATPSSGSDFNQSGAYTIDASISTTYINVQSSTLALSESGVSAFPRSIISVVIGSGVAKLYRNDPTVPKATDASVTIDSNSTGYLIAARYLSGVVDPTYFSEMDVSEILVFPTALSDDDRAAVETYLNNKWAIY